MSAHPQLLTLTDGSGRRLGWTALLGPAIGPGARAELDALRERSRFVGFTGWFTFPAGDGVARELCEAWLHCFRDPGRWLPAGVPRLLLAHADFLDYQRAERAAERPGGLVADYVYVGGPAAFSDGAKNWELMRACLPQLGGELGLRGLLVSGAAARDGVPDGWGSAIEHLPWEDLMQAFARARFVIVPSLLDPCPRVIAEALAVGTPVVVNRRILGGWHYVTPYTGTFFDGAADVVAAVRRLETLPLSPRRWFRSHHGSWLAGERLRRFLAGLDPRFRDVRGLTLRQDHDLAEAA